MRIEEKRLKFQSESEARSLHLLTEIKEFTRPLLVDLTNGRSSPITLLWLRFALWNRNSLTFHGIPSTHTRNFCKITSIALGETFITCTHLSFWISQLWTVQLMIYVSLCIAVAITLMWLVMGWIRFFDGKRTFDCISSPDTAHPVPVHAEEVNDIVSVACYILVVEKESVFQRLANDQFCNANHCIVITGRGYPDIPTRRFLQLLVENLHLPAYCLVDCDPYGFDILTTYRFGSMTRKVEAMLLRCYLQKVPRWRLELKLMLQKGVKFEIEALSVRILPFLSESYIPSKFKVK